MQAVEALVWNHDTKALTVRIKFLLPLLEDKDLRVRRAATWVVSNAANAEGSLQEECHTLHASMIPLSGVGPVPDSPQEQELIKKVRDAAAKWLQDNDK